MIILRAIIKFTPCTLVTRLAGNNEKPLFTKIKLLLALAITTTFAVNFSHAQDHCLAIDCDCSNLPSESWSKTCEIQEARLIADCVKDRKLSSGYCSVHGPSANRLPLSLELGKIDPVNIEDVKALSNQVAIFYWGLIKNFEEFENLVDNKKFVDANKKLTTIEHNLDSLFSAQRTITQSFINDKKDAEAQAIWRNYAPDTLFLGSDFFARGEKILNSYDTFAIKLMRDQHLNLGLRLMKLSGQAFEQAGYSYAEGIRHKHAAKSWKHASQASSLVMAHATSDLTKGNTGDYYSFQSAARLHRASYHWVIGTGPGTAEDSLTESMDYMKDGSSLSSLIEEENRIRESKVLWGD